MPPVKRNVRTCVVRLEKCQQSPPEASGGGRSTKTAAKAAQQPKQEETGRGGRAVKKRFQTPSPPPVESKAKEKPQPKSAKQAPAKDLTPPPTIAAGRSRRSIKPNPRYASEDMVTPRMIKSVGQTAASTSKKAAASDSDDFYNRNWDSDSEMSFEDYVKPRKPNRSTTSAAKAVKSPADPDDQTNRLRGKVTRTRQDTSRPSQASTPITVRSTPTPMHILRKSMPVTGSTSANRPTTLPGQKRKLDTSEEDDDEEQNTTTTKKRILLASSNVNTKEQSSATSRNSNIAAKKVPPSQTFNGNKVFSSASHSAPSPAILRSTPLQRKEISTKQQQIVSPQNLTSATAAKAYTPKTFVQKKQQSVSPVVLNQNKGKQESSERKTSEENEDADGMPTFTIVNIHDIINKKGDVLISKTDTPPRAPIGRSQRAEATRPQPQKPQASNTTAATNKSANQTANKSLSATAATKSANTSTTANKITNAIVTISDDSSPPNASVDRRRTIHNAVLAEKASQPKPLPVRSPVAKKQAPTILNHMLHNRTTAAQQRQAEKVDKPAPRILNSMVAKRTQPVKPKIANFDDSADESVNYDDDDLILDLIENEDRKAKSPIKQQQVPRTTLNASKNAAPGAVKENLLGETNRMDTKPIPRKPSPEKVVISRQGDKIIKKITCFESWYVISPRPSIVEAPARNILDIPLIRLANLAKNIKLPSDEWESHVNLFEVSAATLAKSKLTTFTGDIAEYGFSEENRHKYQPSCITFRRVARDDNPRVPYDRAVIFKNKTFITHIDGKNVRLVGAPHKLSTIADVEILLELVDGLALDSDFVETASPVNK